MFKIKRHSIRATELCTLQINELYLTKQCITMESDTWYYGVVQVKGGDKLEG